MFWLAWQLVGVAIVVLVIWLGWKAVQKFRDSGLTLTNDFFLFVLGVVGAVVFFWLLRWRH